MFIQPSVNGDSILEFFRKYFILPITEISGYNWINTTVYGLILSITAIIAYRAIEKTEYKINLDLFLVFLPYQILGSTVRALVDAEVYPYSYLLVTPGIVYTTLFIFTISVMLTSYLKERINIEIGRTVFIIGGILAASQLIIVLPLIKFPQIGLLLIVSSSIIYFLMWALHHYLGTKIHFLRSRENLLVFLFHFFDATVTVIGIELYSYRELHILPHTLIDNFGSAIIMYPLKIVILFGVLYLIDHYVEEQDMSLFIKMVMMAIGLVPAIRNYLRLVMGA